MNWQYFSFILNLWELGRCEYYWVVLIDRRIVGRISVFNYLISTILFFIIQILVLIIELISLLVNIYLRVRWFIKFSFIFALQVYILSQLIWAKLMDQVWYLVDILEGTWSKLSIFCITSNVTHFPLNISLFDHTLALLIYFWLKFTLFKLFKF